MTVLARSKTGGALMRRHRQGSERRGTTTGATRGDAPDGVRQTETEDQAIPAERRRDGGVPQDRAVYTCQCGFVFSAQVSTSVDCPHCGGAQAW